MAIAQYLAYIESLGLRSLKNQLNGNSKFKSLELLNDWSDACPDAIVGRQWLNEVIHSQIDWIDGHFLNRHCLNGQRLDGRQLKGWWLDWWWLNEVRVGQWSLYWEEVATVMLARQNYHSALQLGGRFRTPNPIDSCPIQMIHNWMRWSWWQWGKNADIWKRMHFKNWDYFYGILSCYLSKGLSTSMVGNGRPLMP